MDKSKLDNPIALKDMNFNDCCKHAGPVLSALLEITNVKDRIIYNLKDVPDRVAVARFEKKLNEAVNEASKIIDRVSAIQENKNLVKNTLCKYYDYYGKNASTPSVGLTEISWKYVRLYNTHGLLATYNRKTGEFTPKYE